MKDDRDFWHTTRPHDDACATQRTIAEKEKQPTPPCLLGCRVGQPWPTLRLDGVITTERSS